MHFLLFKPRARLFQFAYIEGCWKGLRRVCQRSFCVGWPRSDLEMPNHRSYPSYSMTAWGKTLDATGSTGVRPAPNFFFLLNTI